MMPRTALRLSSHTASITPREMPKRHAISDFDGILCSTHTAISGGGKDYAIVWQSLRLLRTPLTSALDRCRNR